MVRRSQRPAIRRIADRLPSGSGPAASLRDRRLRPPRGADPLLAALTDLMCVTTWLPDFMSLPPRGMDTTFAGELAAVPSRPPARLRADLLRSSERRPLAPALDRDDHDRPRGPARPVRRARHR
jgi:hypothetical protein